MLKPSPSRSLLLCTGLCVIADAVWKDCCEPDFLVSGKCHLVVTEGDRLELAFENIVARRPPATARGPAKVGYISLHFPPASVCNSTMRSPAGVQHESTRSAGLARKILVTTGSLDLSSCRAVRTRPSLLGRNRPPARERPRLSRRTPALRCRQRCRSLFAAAPAAKTNGRPGNGTLAAGIRSRQIANVNGLTVHILEAGYEAPGRPAILLLHGFPELAYSWRKVMPSLAAAGYHVIAPDQRGHGRTTGWDDSYDADPDPFRILNMTRNAIALVYALGHRSVAMVAGHDAGALVACWSALIRPDIFRSITIMSSPFEGAPLLPFDTANGAPMPRSAPTDISAHLCKALIAYSLR